MENMIQWKDIFSSIRNVLLCRIQWESERKTARKNGKDEESIRSFHAVFVAYHLLKLVRIAHH